MLAVARPGTIAGKPTPPASTALDGLALVGFVALADTPRAGAPADRRPARGRRPAVMITGDHPRTAHAIARPRLPADTPVVTGPNWQRWTKSGLSRGGPPSGFARVTPEQKVQVIAGAAARGRVVAMVGDGTNDAAAIRLADVGIGLAGRGSAAARNAADLVLTDDDLARCIERWCEGRACGARCATR